MSVPGGHTEQSAVQKSGAMMLRVNLNEQDDQLEHSVKQTCSEVGRVTWVKVHRSPSPIALVEMVSAEHSFKLTERLGGSTFGNCALVHLEHNLPAKT
jgi:hypothetical protein